jgi:hypothetical protein
MKESWDLFQSRFGPIVKGPEGRYTLHGELAVLLTLAVRRQPRKILEMFTAYGHTACALAAACTTSEVFAFDVAKELGGYDAHSPFVGEVMSQKDVGSAILNAPEAVRSRIRLTVRNGLELADHIRVSGPYELVFVDGDHTWRHVADDTKLALELASDDAVIVWDDYSSGCPEVARFIDTLNGRSGDPVILVGGTRIGYTILNEEKRRTMRSAISDL